MNELISIIVPVYNVEKYLKQCINSILSQTYKNIEIILIDDGSTDNSGKICDEYACIDKRIKVIHQKNKGLSDARNAGIKKASGKYIGFVDSDDYISKDMYESLYKVIKIKNYDIAICNHITFYNNVPIFSNTTKTIEYTKTQAIQELLKIKNRKIYDFAWNKLYKKELFKNINYPSGKVFEDIGTTYLLFDKSNKIILTDAILYAYRNRPKSISNNTSIKNIYDKLEMVKLRSNFLLDNYTSIKDEIISNKTIYYTLEFANIAKKSNYSISDNEYFKKIYTELKTNNYKLLIKNIGIKKYFLYKLLIFNKNIFMHFYHIIYIFLVKSNKLKKIILNIFKRNDVS